jgi:hypothetical protein
MLNDLVKVWNKFDVNTYSFQVVSKLKINFKVWSLRLILKLGSIDMF